MSLQSDLEREIKRLQEIDTVKAQKEFEEAEKKRLLKLNQSQTFHLYADPTLKEINLFLNEVRKLGVTVYPPYEGLQSPCDGSYLSHKDEIDGLNCFFAYGITWSLAYKGRDSRKFSLGLNQSKDNPSQYKPDKTAEEFNKQVIEWLGEAIKNEIESPFYKPSRNTSSF